MTIEVPSTDYPEKAQSLADLVQRLVAAPTRLAAGIAGLTPDELNARPFADEKTTAECVQHVASASVGWTNMMYEAIEDVYTTPRTHDRQWHQALEQEIAAGTQSALAVYERHNQAVANFLAALPATDFLRPFKPVAFLTEPFQIGESINWGCVLHADCHLAQIHLKRIVFGKPLAWLAVYPQRWPHVVQGHTLPK